MPELNHLGVGGVIFVIGAIVYIVNLLLGLVYTRLTGRVSG